MSIPKRRNETEILQRVPDVFGDGSQSVTTAGTRVQLITTVTPCMRAVITAKGSNTGNIWVGGSTVANGRGKQLVPLQDIEIFIDDLSKVYIDATSSGDGVCYVYEGCE